MICTTCIWEDLRQCEPDAPDSCEDYDGGKEHMWPAPGVWAAFMEDWVEYVDDEDLLFF